LDFADFYPFECPQTGNPLHCKKFAAADASDFCISKSGLSKRRLCPASFEFIHHAANGGGYRYAAP